MKRLGTLLGAGFVILLALVALALVAEDRAASRAREFCSRFTEGGSFADVQRAAAESRDAAHSSVRDNEVAVDFVGLPPFSRQRTAGATKR